MFIKMKLNPRFKGHRRIRCNDCNCHIFSLNDNYYWNGKDQLDSIHLCANCVRKFKVKNQQSKVVKISFARAQKEQSLNTDRDWLFSVGLPVSMNIESHSFTSDWNNQVH